MRYLGIDYGSRYVGLALGDDETRMAMPYKTIDQTWADLFAILKEVVASEGIESVVVGMPENVGSSTEQEEATRVFITTLADRIDTPVYAQNERYTSKQSQQHRKEGSTADEHSIAAMLILQGYLDSLPSTEH
ncbi:MAG: Holliday junction resolvase RuvX [Patescibacteria group bacterium]